MVKPVCVPCGLFFRPHRNGQVFEEGKPYQTKPDEPIRFYEPGSLKPWTSYKLWRGDQWICRGCGATIILGAGQNYAEHYQKNYELERDKAGGDKVPFVHDC